VRITLTMKLVASHSATTAPARLGGMLDDFRPFGYTDDEWEAQQVLRDGAPEDLREALYSWLLQVFTDEDGYLESGLGLAIRSKLQIDLGERAGGYVSSSDLLYELRALTDLELLRLTDFAVAFDPRHRENSPPQKLIDMFLVANSKWSPQWNGSAWRLADRVPEGVQMAVEATTANSGSAGRLLRDAWVDAFGVTPNEGNAYKMAVKAVETAAHPFISPKNQGATLGTMIANFRDQDGWTLPYAERSDHAGSNKQTVLLLMQTLWEGQEDRHRDGTVGLQEARTAVFAAATLVAWFEGGYVTRK
jgi:hypothetical protein